MNHAENEYNGMYWFEVVNMHPDPKLESVIHGLAAEFSRELGIQPPPIGWYKKAQGCIASSAYNSSAKAPLYADPTLSSCKYFRTDDNKHSGYTPFRSHTIMIAIDTPTEKVLEAVADECFHVLKDQRHGFGWREANFDTAEREAPDFANSKRAIIREAL